MSQFLLGLLVSSNKCIIDSVDQINKHLSDLRSRFRMAGQFCGLLLTGNDLF